MYDRSDAGGVTCRGEALPHPYDRIAMIVEESMRLINKPAHRAYLVHITP